MNALQYHLIVREWVLSASLPLAVFMTAIFATNVILGIKAGLNWYHSLWLQAALALFTFTLGVALRSGWVWPLLRSDIRAEEAQFVIEGFWWIDVVAGVLTIIGGLCVVRVFTPDTWNERRWYLQPWALAGFATALFVALVHLI